MPDYRPFQVMAYDKNLTRLGPVRAPRSLQGVRRRNAAGDCEFTVDADDPRAAQLATAGTRVVVTYRWEQDATPVPLISGRVATRGGGVTGPRGARRFVVRDDWNLFNSLGWPNPAQSITSQTSRHDTIAGPAETVVGEALQLNVVDRLGVPITIPVSQGRGDNVLIRFRMHRLADRLFPRVTRAGILVELQQIDGARTLLVREPTVHTRKLTEGSGVLVGGEFEGNDPLVTHVVVGAGGQGIDRVFRQFINTAAADEIGEPLEAFVDARDIETTDPDLESLVADRSDELMEENARKVSLNFELMEQSWFRFAKNYDVGDQVPIELADGLTFTDHIQDVEWKWLPGGSAQFKPHLGEWDNTANSRINRYVAQLARGLRDLQRSY